MTSASGSAQLGQVVVVGGPVLREVKAYLKRASDAFWAESAYNESAAMTELRADIDRAISAAGSLSARTGSSVPPSTSTDRLTTKEVAKMLKLSERHVTNLAEQLDGRRIAGRWTFGRLAVLAELNRRSDAA